MADMISGPSIERLMDIHRELALGKTAWVDDHCGQMASEYVAVLEAIEDLISCAAGPELATNLRETRGG